MQWNRQTLVPPTPLDRLRLRRAALRYAAHGWAVAPGACLTGHRFACGRPGCPIMGCHPAIESWEDDATADDARVAAWWRRRPHAVLLATGWKFDVLDVPAAVGPRALGAARRRGCAGPVAVTPAGRWMFLVRPGLALRAELDRCPGVVRHGRGSWVPAAPSRMPEGAVRWAVPPDRAHWRIPEPAGVQEILVDALGSLDRRRIAVPAVAVPRELSTARRAA